MSSTYFLATSIAIVVVSSTAAAQPVADESSSVASPAKCLDTSRHKTQPSYEPELYKTCNPYGGLSCCTNETAARVHGDDLYNLEKLSCQKQLSTECRKFFLKDACFFECSPEISNWATVEGGTEVVKNIPLCRSDCESWFSACANDNTCTQDWKTAHADSRFTCKGSNNCQTFKQKFKTAESFCKKVWGNSYTVVEDSPSSCVKINIPYRKDPENRDIGNQDSDNSGASFTYTIVVIVAPLMSLFVGNSL